MEENNVSSQDTASHLNKSKLNQQQIAGAIIVAGIIVAGAILLKGTTEPQVNQVPNGGNMVAGAAVPERAAGDQIMGNTNAEITLILYEDFQCPFCGKFFQESEGPIKESYMKNGQVKIVYRDFAFLGTESVRAAEAARCAGDQGKFWEYHDYLYTHQNGENNGAFADVNLKSFARNLGLNEGSFNACLDTSKHSRSVVEAKNEATLVGVSGTPKGFILKNGKVLDTIDGAIPYVMVQQKLDAALK